MDCPKCHAQLSPAATECSHCGIIIDRYLVHEARRSHVEPAARVAPTWTAARIGRGALILAFAIWTLTLIGGVNAARVNGSFLHLPNLVFHEAGHILFLPFGHFMSMLGGSLTQVLVPLVCAGAFLWQTRDPFGACIAIWWAGENLIDLAPYINDARALQLVLLGGKTGAEVEGHDWEYLLNAMGVAHLDHSIASVVQGLGVLTMIGALAWGAVIVVRGRT